MSFINMSKELVNLCKLKKSNEMIIEILYDLFIKTNNYLVKKYKSNMSFYKTKKIKIVNLQFF